MNARAVSSAYILETISMQYRMCTENIVYILSYLSYQISKHITHLHYKKKRYIYYLLFTTENNIPSKVWGQCTFYWEINPYFSKLYVFNLIASIENNIVNWHSVSSNTAMRSFHLFIIILYLICANRFHKIFNKILADWNQTEFNNWFI